MQEKDCCENKGFIECNVCDENRETFMSEGTMKINTIDSLQISIEWKEKEMFQKFFKKCIEIEILNHKNVFEKTDLQFKFEKNSKNFTSKFLFDSKFKARKIYKLKMKLVGEDILIYFSFNFSTFADGLPWSFLLHQCFDQKIRLSIETLFFIYYFSKKGVLKHSFGSLPKPLFSHICSLLTKK